ncbi:MAG: hypothetical protein K8L99_16390 [Anaerolineae bacterium]|nr:hypothetical protein [Anaerolineae bacterium]
MANANGSEKAEEVIAEAKQELTDFKREAYQRAEEARKEVAKQLNTAAETIRKEVRDGNADKEAVQRADEIAARLEKTAHYLNNHSAYQMGEQATKIVTRNPWRAVIIALVVGLVLGLISRGK